MAYKPIDIDRNALTIMGVNFPNRLALERAAKAIGSNMFEDFEPTAELIELYRDYIVGKVTLAMLPARIKQKT